MGVIPPRTLLEDVVMVQKRLSQAAKVRVRACRTNAAKGQGLRRGCAGGGRGTPERVHMQEAAR